MSKLLSWFSISAGVLLLGTASDTCQAQTQTIDPPAFDIELGMGFDSKKGIATGQVCIVNFVPHHEKLRQVQAGGRAQEDFVKYRHVTDKAELTTHYEVSAELVVKALMYNVSSKASFSREIALKAESLNVSAFAVVTNAPISVTQQKPGMRIEVPKQFRLSNGEVDPKRCGDSFIQTIFGGAELSAVLSIKTTSAGHRTKLMGQIEGGQGIFSGNLKATGDTKSETSSEEVQVYYTRSGGSGSPLAMDLAALKTAIQALKADAQKAAAFRKITVSSYDQFLEKVRPSEKERDFRVIADQLGRMRTVWDYARQVHLQPYLFIMERNVTMPYLVELEGKLAAHVTRLENAARACIEKARCDIRKDDEVSDLDYWIHMPVSRGSFQVDHDFSTRADTKRQNEQNLSNKRVELSSGSRSESQKTNDLQPFLKQVSDDQDQLNALDRQYVPALVNHLMMSNIKLPNDRRCKVPESRCLTAAEIDKLQERLEKRIIEIEKSRQK